MSELVSREMRADIPRERRDLLRRAVRLELWTIAYLLSCIVLLYLVMGSSQAMKTAWIEDILSLLPPIGFLIALWFTCRPRNQQFPYGYYGVVSIAFVVSAVSLLGVGGFLLIDAMIKLVTAEHPTIGSVDWFGEPIWLGWLMLPVLAWGIFIIFLGRAKLKLAGPLHDKTLYTDAKMNKADWMTAAAAMLGVLGIMVGWWWADATAAALISLDIMHDGLRQLRASVGDLLQSAPRTVDNSRRESLPARLATECEKLEWVDKAVVRLREVGHLFFGEIYVQPVDRRDLLPRSEEVLKTAYALDWRLRDLTVQFVDPTDELPDFSSPLREKETP